VHEELWKKLEDLDHEQTAVRAGCEYQPDSSAFEIKLLNCPFEILLEEKKIISKGDISAGFLEQLCLLAYLIDAKNLPLAEKLVKAESLPGGQFFFRGPHELPLKKLQDAFGTKAELLLKAAEAVNAEVCDFGDASVKVQVLPRVPIVFVIWAGDDEFPARASILFDQTAADQLPLDALMVAVNLSTKALLSTASNLS
jgi:hypothetical protein